MPTMACVALCRDRAIFFPFAASIAPAGTNSSV